MTDDRDPYRLSVDQRGVFVTAALVAAIGPGQAMTFSQLRWLCEHARHVERVDADGVTWTKVVAAQLADDVGLPAKTIRNYLADFAAAGWAQRRQDLGSSFDRSSWWRLMGQAGRSKVPNRDLLNVPDRDLVPLYETEETSLGRAPKSGDASPTQRSKPPRKRTMRDDVFDALLTVDGVEVGTKLTRSQGSLYGKLARELIEVDATADDVDVRARRYRSLHPSWELTASALVKHWGSLTPTKRTARRRSTNTDPNPTEWSSIVHGDD